MNPLHESLRALHPDLLGVYEQSPAPRWKIDAAIAARIEEVVYRLVANLEAQTQ